VKRIGIFGTSGMAREAGDVAFAQGYVPIYIARSQSELASWKFSSEVMLESAIERYKKMPFIIGIGENSIRQKIAQRFSRDINFCNLIHPSATFGYEQRKVIEDRIGVIVCAGVRFTNNIEIGNFNIFNQNATVAHDVVIEDFVHVAPGSIISGNVHIECRCWIGAGSTINQGSFDTKLRIGADTTIGSGAVVIASCDSDAIYVGVPAKRIK
jgi:sugar O-acyltransferase (sialic acid O-acetyltransferase NeuD family)